MDDKTMKRGSNSDTLRTQRFVSNKWVVTAFIAIQDIVFLLVWNCILNFFLDFKISNNWRDYIRIGFYQSENAWKLYVFFAVFIAIYDIRQAYRFYISFSEKDINVGQKGMQRWTTEKEIKEQYKCIPDADQTYPGEPGAIISRIEDKLYIDTSNTNNLFFGITRSGKDEMFVTPTIDVCSRAEKQPSLVINDPKLDTYKSCKTTLEERNYLVYLLNLDDPLHSMGDDPLDATVKYQKIGDTAKAMATARAFAFSIFHSDKDNAEPIWANTATDLFTALILAQTIDLLHDDEVINNERWSEMKEKQKKFETLSENEQVLAREKYASALAQGQDITDPNIEAIPPEETFWYTRENEIKINIYSIINLFTNLVRIHDEDNPYITGIDYYFRSRDDMDVAKLKYATIESGGTRLKGSVYTNMLSALGVFIDENIAKMTAESSLDLKDIGFGDRPVAVFLGIPDYDTSNHFIASTFVRQVYYINAQAATRKNGVCDRKIRFILNEFGNMPPIEAMDQLVTVGAGRGITFDLYVQSYQQLEKIYGKNAATIRDNCGNKIYIKSTDGDTLEEFKKMLGNETIVNLQRTGDRMSLDKHVMETPEDHALMDINMLKNLCEGECVIDRTMKRRDNKNKHIIPYPIFNGIENGRRLKYRYEYLEKSFPSPKTINLQDILDESRENINLKDRVLDYHDVLDSLNYKQGGGNITKVKDLKNYEKIEKLLQETLGKNYQDEFEINGNCSIPMMCEFIENNSYIPEEKRSALLGLIESEVA